MTFARGKGLGEGVPGLYLVTPPLRSLPPQHLLVQQLDLYCHSADPRHCKHIHVTYKTDQLQLDYTAIGLRVTGLAFRAFF